MTAVAFFYVEMGRPWWKDAVANLIRSARETQPGCGVMHLCDRKTGQHPDADGALCSEEPIGAERLMMAKGWMWAETARRTEQSLILTDADVEFRRDMLPLFDDDFDVALLRRTTGERAAGQPYLAAMALVKPTDGARKFWADYVSVLQCTPKGWHAWWCDQIAFAALLGANRSRQDYIDCDGYRVRLLDVDTVAPKEEKPGCYAVHYKGRHEEKSAA